MSIVNIFIASSYDTAHERTVVGDAVRRLNDIYEPQGWRVKMYCWEDYTPEYKGIRKQTEYNEHLIKKSDIFVALFRSNCGNYTQEEIRVWADILHREPNVFDIIDKVANKTAVRDYLKNKGFTPVLVESDADIYEKLDAIVTNHIAHHPSHTPGNIAINTKDIYATIPEDRASERAPFGNLVRSIDDLAERVFHSRCRLITGDESKILTSNYYVAILKDSVSTSEEREILTAIQSCMSTQSPAVQLYYNYDDAICNNHPKLGAIIRHSGIFNEAYDSLYRVRFNLVRWLYQQTIMSVKLETGIDIRNGWFIFFNLPVIPMEQLGISGGTMMQQLAQLMKLFSFEVLGVNTQVTTSTGEVNLSALEEQMTRVDSVSNALNEVEAEIRQRREEWLQQVSANIDIILSGDVTIENIGTLTDLINKKGKLQADLSTNPREQIRTQMLMVQVSDTFSELFSTTGIDVNAQYLKLIQTADRFGIKDPTVEMVRMNYANYLNSLNRNAESLEYYETAIKNIETLDDHSELLRYYIMHLYVTYINYLSFLGENAQAVSAIRKLMQKESAWEQIGISEVEKTANNCQILACQLRIRPLQGNVAELLNRSMKNYQQACKIPQEDFDKDIRTDIFCDLPNCIASTMIDAQPYLNMEVYKLKRNVDFFLNQVVTYANLHRDEESSMFYLSEALHNWAFFYSNLKGEQLRARNLCKKALDTRRQIYTDSRQPEKLYEVGESLLMLGATYINGIKGELNENDFLQALCYAEECLRIYNTLNQEHYLEQDLRVHQALQLKGSILYYGGKKTEGLELLKQAWEWNMDHLDNSYANTFYAVAGEILKKESLI